jgi:hypothetical protein
MNIHTVQSQRKKECGKTQNEMEGPRPHVDEAGKKGPTSEMKKRMYIIQYISANGVLLSYGDD